MALETGTFISDLVAGNPTGSDALAFADDHLRLIKSTLKSTFPNISGAVTKSHTAINNIPDNTTQSLANIQASINQISGAALALATIYPVGSIYINASNNTNPATLFGFGTWVAFGAGRVMVGLNGADPLFDALEETGGSKDATVVAHTHTGTTTTAAAHQHTSPDGNQFVTTTSGGSYGGGGSSLYPGGSNLTQAAGAHNHTFTTDSTGSSGTNANLQPYITVAMWKRTA